MDELKLREVLQVILTPEELNTIVKITVMRKGAMRNQGFINLSDEKTAQKVRVKGLSS
jgi:hypothetical protein